MTNSFPKGLEGIEGIELEVTNSFPKGLEGIEQKGIEVTTGFPKGLEGIEQKGIEVTTSTYGLFQPRSSRSDAVQCHQNHGDCQTSLKQNKLHAVTVGNDDLSEKNIIKKCWHQRASLRKRHQHQSD